VQLKEIAKLIGVDCASDIEIDNLATLKEATSSSVSFLHDTKYKEQLPTTKAAAVIIKKEHAKELPKSAIALIAENPYQAMAKATSLFAHKVSAKTFPPKVEEGANIAQDLKCGRDVVIGANCTIMPGVYLGDNVKIGKNTIIYPNVTIYHDCKIGSNVTIHSGTVVGSDGFGFADKVKFYQIGNVVIEDNVEIGSNCTIDRAALGSTQIKEGVKMDNLIQVGHNCIIGEYSVIVSQVGLSGSTTLGKGVVMGGQSATAGHLTIGDGAMLAARSGVTKSLDGGKVYGGFPAVDIKLWRKMQAAIMRLTKKK
jgi:UDP-3-O-[3-hydroxymyristoyl] glucosamine N-acyltransferase